MESKKPGHNAEKGKQGFQKTDPIKPTPPTPQAKPIEVYDLSVGFTIPTGTQDADLQGFRDMLDKLGLPSELNGIKVNCDFPKCEISTEEGYPSISEALEAAKALGWKVKEDKTYCPECAKKLNRRGEEGHPCETCGSPTWRGRASGTLGGEIKQGWLCSDACAEAFFVK